jgi:type IV pilus assembly protein PilN
MRLDINLATHHYEDARQFWMRWGTGLGVLAIATLALLITTILGWNDARLDRNKIADLRAKIAERDKERADAEALLNRPENRVMRDKSQYLNDLIARKSFSWTRAFEDLERVMPPRIHLVSIAPELNDENQLAIKMEVAGDSSERAIELVRRMEASQHFRETQIETQGPAQQPGDAVQFGISAVYVPTHDQETLDHPAQDPATQGQPSRKKPARKQPAPNQPLPSPPPRGQRSTK